jgi:hypothetical protein
VIHGDQPGAIAPATGRYVVVTLAGHSLGEVFVAEGQEFPDSREVAGPGVEVRYVLVEPCAYLMLAS